LGGILPSPNRQCCLHKNLNARQRPYVGPCRSYLSFVVMSDERPRNGIEHVKKLQREKSRSFPSDIFYHFQTRPFRSNPTAADTRLNHPFPNQDTSDWLGTVRFDAVVVQQRMGFEPQQARRRLGIGTGCCPPGRLVATAMDLAVMPAAQRHRELVADLAADRRRLRETKMMRIGGRAATDQAGLLHHSPSPEAGPMASSANPPSQ
jgi:hypothetical protein